MGILLDPVLAWRSGIFLLVEAFTSSYRMMVPCVLDEIPWPRGEANMMRKERARREQGESKVGNEIDLRPNEEDVYMIHFIFG